MAAVGECDDGEPQRGERKMNLSTLTDLLIPRKVAG